MVNIKRKWGGLLLTYNASANFTHRQEEYFAMALELDDKTR